MDGAESGVGAVCGRWAAAVALTRKMATGAGAGAGSGPGGEGKRGGRGRAGRNVASSGAKRPGPNGVLRGVPREPLREEPKMRYAGFDNPNSREFTPYPYQHIMRVNRVVNVTKGGRRQSFNALVVLGNMRGSAGFGFGKGTDVRAAVKRAFSDAHKNVIYVDMYNGRTVNHELFYKYGASKVLIRPQRKDGPYRAGRPYLPVLEAFGFKEVSIKTHGSRNMLNVLKAIWNALARHRSAEDVARARGKTLVDVSGAHPDPRKRRLDPNAHFYEL
ncbi:ribosomal protein S5 [Thecamonas trahens ATCC 50062]|uniref:Ribosomal protein S5 n=1 Tax=Thecamonas trahens ATCC 50062 TaxID=461836 RepID=A0A0L0DK61_THETB|nr:ribosomal protein S5 [Thecamonas trahens ATCC 50062]KNC52580.1 ribosomal protein S5 [Thecamonas trahens ATCC 50062]|eukprot:XP_013755140.1 ribosomal protein S5 [Thecamonas trahens ATCC 50062]